MAAAAGAALLMLLMAAALAGGDDSDWVRLPSKCEGFGPVSVHSKSCRKHLDNWTQH